MQKSNKQIFKIQIEIFAKGVIHDAQGEQTDIDAN